jgi:hypothetical protein
MKAEPHVMATVRDIQRRVNEVPFRPFRVILKGDRRYDVPQASWTIASEAIFFLVGVPPEDDPHSDIPDHTDWVDYRTIGRVECLEANQELSGV